VPKSRVALVRCNDYGDELVYDAVRRGLDLLGGAAGLIRPGEKIVLKPNILIAASPERCVTTHPAVVRAAGLLLREAGRHQPRGAPDGVRPG
jgi:uncharacterized protein (DUF362 family)